MNRLDFIAQTHRGQLIPIEYLIEIFDRLMVAYGFIGNNQNINIGNKTEIIHSCLKLHVESSDESTLQSIKQGIDQTIHNTIQLYGKSYYVSAIPDTVTSMDLFIQEIIPPTNR